MSYYGAEFPKEFILEEGDLIMPMTEQVIGLFGNTAFIPETTDYTFVLNQRVGKVIYDEKKVDKYYLHYLLATNSVKQQIEARASGTRQRNISPENVYDVEVDIPDISVQERIGRFLYLLEEKQIMNNKTIQELETMAKTIYDYWFLQFNFPNEEGKPYKSSGGKMVWNEELGREIPAGWRVGKLKELATITMGSSPKGESLNEDGNGIIFYQGKADFGYRFPMVRMYTNSPIRYAEINDILLSVRAPVGSMNIADQRCCIGRGLAALHCSYQSFLYYFMLSNQYQFDKFNNSGTTFGAITRDELFDLRVVIPNGAVIRLFEEKVKPIDWEITNNEKQNKELMGLRDYLLPLLMNGQVGLYVCE